MKNFKEDIENLSKKLYLESPDLWIEFSDKMNENRFDEMVLFFAAKYGFLSIIKHSIGNNLINLEQPSKNKSFATVKDHILSVSKQNNETHIYNYIKNPNDSSIVYDKINSDYKAKETSTNCDNIKKKYIPKYICKNCNQNIFECGYSLSEQITYKYSEKENKLVESSKKLKDFIICAGCNFILEDISIESLNNLCSIQNCHVCGHNLTLCGIINKTTLVFNSSVNSFDTSSKSYQCTNCDSPITKEQVNFFNI